MRLAQSRRSPPSLTKVARNALFQPTLILNQISNTWRRDFENASITQSLRNYLSLVSVLVGPVVTPLMRAPFPWPPWM